MDEQRTYSAFEGAAPVASGSLAEVLPELKGRFDRDPGVALHVFDDRTGRQVDFDLRGSVGEVVERALPPARTGPGRPRLGVVSREISLLPRHWEWLEEQPNGASAAIRRLVDEARGREPERQRARRAAEAAGRVMSAMAGDLPGYEEATRALYAFDRPRLLELMAGWPAGIRAYVERLTGA
jgi:uncharacterized protein